MSARGRTSTHLPARGAPRAPTPPRVDLWTADLDALPVPADVAGVLSAGERERARRLWRPADRHRAIVRRALLRHLLAAYTGVPAAALPLAAGPAGKPHVVGLALELSLAHRAGLAVYAVCRDAPVGVDLECSAPVAEADEIVARQFAPAEAERYAALPPARRAAAFLDLWTAKEAYVKGTGEGLAAGLDHFAVVGRRVQRLDGPPWFVRWLSIAGHRVAVACPGAAPVLVARELTDWPAQVSQKQQPTAEPWAAPIRPLRAAGTARSMAPP